MQAIATSSGQNDSGLFELNFRDERYLPFEGAGVISRWRIDMPKDCNAFDFITLTDVILHLKYTAREGGEMLGSAAKKAILDSIKDPDVSPLTRLFSARHEFPTEWDRFLHPTDQTATSQTMQLDLSFERFPFQFRNRSIQISEVELFLKLKDEKDSASKSANTYTEEYAGGTPLKISLTPGGGEAVSTQLDSIAGLFAGTPHKEIVIKLVPPTKLSIEVKEDDIKLIAPALLEQIPAPDGHTRLRTEAVEDLFVVVHYSVTSS